MELRVLTYFLAVAHFGSISKAAEDLHTTQPNLSRQMQNLEQEVGSPLLVRGKRGITLTEAGKTLQKRATEILELYQKTQTELQSKDTAIVADIHIGCGESYAIRLIAQAAQQMRAQHPGIKLHLFSGDASIVTERLDKGLLDFGVLINFDNLAPYEHLRLPLTDTWGILMRRDSPLAKKDGIVAADLQGAPLIYSQQPLYKKNMLSDWFERGGTKPNIVASYNLIYNASLLVEEGLGYAVGIDRIVSTTEPSVLCFKPFLPKMESHLDVAWKKHQALPRAADIFLSLLREVIQK